MDPQRSGEALARLCAEPDVQAVIAFGSRARVEARPDPDLDLAMIVGLPQLTPAEKMACWKRFNRVPGRQGVAVDLVVAGSADAERLSGSRVGICSAMWLVRAGCCMSPAEDALLLLAIVRRQGWASAPAVPGLRALSSGAGPLGLVQLTPVLELELDAGQIELAPHRHGDAAQIGGEVGFEVEAGSCPGVAQGGGAAGYTHFSLDV